MKTSACPCFGGRDKINDWNKRFKKLRLCFKIKINAKSYIGVHVLCESLLDKDLYKLPPVATRMRSIARGVELLADRNVMTESVNRKAERL